MTDNDVLDEHGMLTERDRQIIRLALRDPKTARGMYNKWISKTDPRAY